MKRLTQLLAFLIVLAALLPAWSDAPPSTTCLITGPDRFNPGCYYCQFNPELSVHQRDTVRFERDGAALGDGFVVVVQTDRETVRPKDPKLELHEGDTVVYVPVAPAP